MSWLQAMAAVCSGRFIALKIESVALKNELMEEKGEGKGNIHTLP